MSIQLLGTKNIAIRVTDEVSVVLIKLIANITGSTTSNEMKLFYTEAFSRLNGRGAVAACSYAFTSEFHGDSNNPANAANTMSNGTHTYGGTTGFKLDVTVAQQSNWPKRVSSMKLYFNNQTVCLCTAYTGYGRPMEARFLTIIVDENDNIYRIPSFGDSGIYVKTNGTLFSIANQDNIYITGIVDGLDTVFTANALPVPDTKIGSISDYIVPEDPYAPGGTSGHGGGTGTFSRTGDSIGIPSLPTLSAVNTGLVNIYNPTIGQMQALANYLWGYGFDIETFKKIFANPMQAILGLSIVPVAVPNGSTVSLIIGNVDSGVSMTKAASQYVEVDCGTLNVEEYWGSYLDYAPYTKCYLYLPYCGTHPIDADEIVGKSVHVVYHVDILSGAVMAFVQCGGTVLYNFAGQCSCQIPVTAGDIGSVISGAIGVASSIGSMVAGVGAGIAGGALGVAGAIGGALGGVASIGQNVLGTKQNTEKSGGIGSMGGMLGVQTPYLIITWPKQAVPVRQNEFIGYPSLITAKLVDLKGFTQIESIHFDNINCTQFEMNEIIRKLKEGVII